MQVCKMKLKKLSPDDIDRLKFLYETVHLINFYVSSQSKDIRAIREYNSMLFPLHQALIQTYQMVRDIRDGVAAITENFDVFELALRRYLEQTNKMFPHQVDRSQPDPPSSLIEDEDARAVWDEKFGSNVYFVSFKKFVKKVIDMEFPEAKINPEFKQYLHYFVNFPDDNMLTVYKWNLLIRLFGPYRDFAVNFCSLVLERGFLGLINRIKAQEILTLEKSPSRILLIRFSRTEPEYLAFSYKDESGEIKHSLNKDDQDETRMIPVAEYLRRKFDGFAFVSQRVCLPSRHNKWWTMRDYAQASSSQGYIIPSTSHPCH